MEQDRYKYNSVTIACYIAAIANEKRYTINMTKLQKLLYISYGVYLAVKEERLVNEYPQAWPYGPVFPTTRNRLLNEDLSSISREDERITKEIKNDEDIRSLLKIVFDNFGTLTASFLSEWSHKDGSPWYKTVKSQNFKWGDWIPDDYIMEYFQKEVITQKA